MTHRAGGGLVLLLAVLSLLVVPRVLNPPAVVGSARIEPPEPPPAVGTCLDVMSTSYATDRNGNLDIPRQPAVMSCGDEHGAEVFRVLDGFEPGNPTAAIPGTVDEIAASCWDGDDDVWSYLGAQTPDFDQLEPGQWFSFPEITVSLTGPDATQRAHGASWIACLVGPASGRTDAPLHDIVVTSGGIPAALSSCYAQHPTETDPLAERTACDRPHRAEILATAWLSAGGRRHDTVPTMEDLTASCETLARAATGRELAGESGVTVEAVRYTWSDTGLVVTTGELPAPATSDDAWAECTITVTDPDRQLTGSLRLIGDAPLPWA